MSFVSQATLSDNSTVFFEELKVKHLKQIFKCTLGEEFNKETLLYNLNIILYQLLKNPPSRINFIDYFILLLEIRMSSIGSIIKIQINDNTTMDLNLEEILKIIKNINIFNLLEFDQFDDKIKVFYKLPSIIEIFSFIKNPDRIFAYFIDKIEIQNEVYSFTDIQEAEKILNLLPVKLFSSINKKVQKIATHFNDINLLAYNKFITNTTLYFNFNINNLCFLIKLLFGDHLMSMYENIFALCKIGNFTPEYIENCTPGEYLLYVKKLEEINRQNSTESLPNQFAQDMFGDNGIENFSEEPLNPYLSPNLPPITSNFQG